MILFSFTVTWLHFYCLPAQFDCKKHGEAIRNTWYLVAVHTESKHFENQLWKWMNYFHKLLSVLQSMTLISRVVAYFCIHFIKIKAFFKPQGKSKFWRKPIPKKNEISCHFFLVLQRVYGNVVICGHCPDCRLQTSAAWLPGRVECNSGHPQYLDTWTNQGSSLGLRADIPMMTQGSLEKHRLF